MKNKIKKIIHIYASPPADTLWPIRAAFHNRPETTDNQGRSLLNYNAMIMNIL